MDDNAAAAAATAAAEDDEDDDEDDDDDYDDDDDEDDDDDDGGIGDAPANPAAAVVTAEEAEADRRASLSFAPSAAAGVTVVVDGGTGTPSVADLAPTRLELPPPPPPHFSHWLGCVVLQTSSPSQHHIDAPSCPHKSQTLCYDQSEITG